MISKSIELLESLRHENGLFSASNSNKTGYKLAWIRDNIYEAIGLESVDIFKAIQTYHSILNILLKHEYKIDHAIKQKPEHSYQYIHARYDPNNLNEIYEPWGNKQNDAIGLFLFKIADLLDNKINILRNEDDKRIIQKLINYLETIEYWNDQDNGIWEEYEEVHASSVGACLAALIKISKYFEVKQKLIDKGKESLNNLLPNESITKDVDLALLTLIWPFNIVTEEQRNKILNNAEGKLLRNKGVIRYVGDKYYNNGKEAEWTMGLTFLALIYKELKNFDKYRYFLQRTINVLNENGELPELYYGESKEHNENSPLGWSQSLLIVALN